MGSCASTAGVERQLSGVLNKELQKEKEKANQVKKILFLGSGGSGKSTTFKQLRQIHGKGFNDNDKKSFIKHIHSQIINEMKNALNVYIGYNHRQKQRQKNNDNDNDNDDDDDKEEEQVEEEEDDNDDNNNHDYDELKIFDDLVLESTLSSMDSANILMNFDYNKKTMNFPNEICCAIKSLWNEDVIKEIYSMRNITKITTSSKYFWDKIDEINNTNYLPSEPDILLCRLKTTGIHEMQFDIKNDTFNIIDVGGQRSQRRKWIHCFEYVVAVIFIASLSCYDEILHEDSSINAMDDQIELFENIINEYSLESTSMILFFNKKDLFYEKFINQQIPLNKCPKFDNYFDANDGFDYNRSTQYIRNEFIKLNKNPNREIFTHLTCATDKNNVQKVFEDVQSIVIQNSLIEAGIMDFEDE